MSCGAVCALLPNQLLLVFQVVNCKGQHSISYTLSRNHTVVVEYSHDKDTDMFQVRAPPASPPSCHPRLAAASKWMRILRCDASPRTLLTN